MALKGTLDDLNIVELIQFPYAGRKTGQLVIEQKDQAGSMFYQDGKLVHAIYGEHEGFEAIVDIVGCEKGGFEFIPNVQPQQVTIKMDLHRLVMQALKTRDERRFAVQRQNQQTKEGTVQPPSKPVEPATPEKKVTTEPPHTEANPFEPSLLPPQSIDNKVDSVPKTSQAAPSAQVPIIQDTDGSLDPNLRSELKKIANANQYVVYLCVLSQSTRALGSDNASGSTQLVADYKKFTEDDAIFDQMRASLSALLATHAKSRGELKRVLIEDEMGIVMLMRLNETATLIVVTSTGTSLGAVSVSVNKMGTQLAEAVANW
jgi:predicted regulator of Ras-like GTPase activity (Roadblock/LC7/MglB family)